MAILLSVMVVGMASCPANEQATAKNLHYPSATSCQSIISDAETDYDSYHYRLACQKAHGMSYLPNQVFSI